MKSSIPIAIRRAARAPLLDAEEERSLIERVQRDGDPDAMHTLVSSHLRMTLSVAMRYAGRGLPVEDLVSEGAVGLCEAAKRFELERGTRFSTYAAWWVRAHIRAFALRNRRVVAMPATRNGRVVMGRAAEAQRRLTADLGRPPTDDELAADLGVRRSDVELVHSAMRGRDVSLTPRDDGPDVRLSAPGPSPEDVVADREWRERAAERVQGALTALDDRELEIVQRRFLRGESQTLRAIGAEMGLSRERVRQLELRAKDKLRRRLSVAAA